MILIADLPGERLDAFVARSVENMSRSGAQKLLEEGCILRNGKGSRDGIEIPEERPARYVEEKIEEEFIAPIITATPFYEAPELEDAPVREKMGAESSEGGKSRRRHRGGRRRNKSGGEGSAPKAE